MDNIHMLKVDKRQHLQYIHMLKAKEIQHVEMVHMLKAFCPIRVSFRYIFEFNHNDCSPAYKKPDEIPYGIRPASMIVLCEILRGRTGSERTARSEIFREMLIPGF